MNKREIADLLASRMGITKKQSFQTVTEFLNIIAETLSDGKDVSLSGFGAFKLVSSGRRKRYDLASRRICEEKEHKVLTFSIGRNLKKRIQSNISQLTNGDR